MTVNNGPRICSINRRSVDRGAGPLNWAISIPLALKKRSGAEANTRIPATVGMGVPSISTKP